ncbi:MAG: ornithine carbamoyltransferase [Eubacteriales bacterium]
MDLLNYQPKEAFAKRHMLTLGEYTQDEVFQILSLALKLKEDVKAKRPHPLLAGKTLAMIFTKSSTRTRVSFETGMFQLGGNALFLSDRDIQLHRGETISDTAKVLSRMVDGIMIRTFAQQDVVDLARYGSIPVINGLTDDFHPCQVLADLMTVYENKGSFENKKMAFIGDGNNVANSLMIGCALVGMDIHVASPKNMLPKESVVSTAKNIAATTGSTVYISSDPISAAIDADVVYTDVWASMGQEEDAIEKYKSFKGFTVDKKLIGHAKKDAIFLHCLPAHRGEEVTSDVIDGKWSAVFDEAENRLHAQKALMVLLMKG